MTPTVPRIHERLLHEYLRYFPCVAVVGPRQCGKTTLLGTLGSEWRVFDLERTSDFHLVSGDPDLFLRLNDAQVAIDEAQLLPELFPALRVAIDSRRDVRGRFVITGSASPALLRSVSESLAGRVGFIEMAPFTFAEVMGRLSSRFFDLLAARASADEFIAKLSPAAELSAAHDYWWRGGYPEAWLAPEERFRTVWLDQYVRTYLYRDVARLFPRLQPTRFQLFIQFLANLSGTIVNYSEVARALGVSQPTVRDYFEIAGGTFLWRHLPSYEKDTLKRVVKHPKGYLRDSGLLRHFLRLPDPAALVSHPSRGRFWEGLVVEEILRGLEGRGLSADACFYRTRGGAEVDLVLDGEFGLIPVEIKYQRTIPARDLRSLHNFVTEHRCRLGVVVNNDEMPRRYSESVVGIPFTWL